MKGFNEAQSKYDNQQPDDFYEDTREATCPQCGSVCDGYFDVRHKRDAAYIQCLCGFEGLENE